MEMAAIVLVVLAALWFGYRIGIDAGRTTLLDAQSLSIKAALSESNDFFRKTGLHGCYSLVGHENRFVADFAVVKYSDLEIALRQKIVPESKIAEVLDDPQFEHGARFEQTYMPTSQLARLVGTDRLTRTEATKRVWSYIELNGLHHEGERHVNCDEVLVAITGVTRCSMFELTKHVKEHLQ